MSITCLVVGVVVGALWRVLTPQREPLRGRRPYRRPDEDDY